MGTNSSSTVYFDTKNGIDAGIGGTEKSKYKYSVSEAQKDNIENGFIKIDDSTPKDFFFVEGNYDNSTLKNLYNAFSKFATGSSGIEELNKIFNDFLKGSAIPYDSEGNQYRSGQKYYKLAKGVAKIADATQVNGFGEPTYSYSLISTRDNADRAIYMSENDIGYKLDYKNKYSNLALPYLLLAVFFEKSLIQQDVLYQQIEVVEGVNKRISENNDMLSAMNIIAQKYYDLIVEETPSCTSSGKHCKSVIAEAELNLKSGVTLQSLNTYLSNVSGSDAYSFGGNACTKVKIVGSNIEMEYAYANQDNEGYVSGKGQFGNIDTSEQSTQTALSNFQEVIRMFGDKCSTEAQLATTYMNQYLQTMNSTIGLATQLCKTVGDYYKNIYNNIR